MKEDAALQSAVKANRGIKDSVFRDLFSTSPVEMPEPELYVIYTGESKIDREYISLSEEFFGGRKTALDVCVRVMTDGQDGDIINQYVVFTKVMDG